MMYFNDCKTLDEVRQLYKKLAMENHPDRGGDTETMQKINQEYAFASARIIKGENLNSEETEQKVRFSEEYREVIEKIAHLPYIKIELVGFWIWVTGKTKPIRKSLREAGLFFAKKKQAWYYRSDMFKVRKGSNMSLDEIKVKYGCEVIKPNRRKTIRQAK